MDLPIKCVSPLESEDKLEMYKNLIFRPLLISLLWTIFSLYHVAVNPNFHSTMDKSDKPDKFERLSKGLSAEPSARDRERVPKGYRLQLIVLRRGEYFQYRPNHTIENMKKKLCEIGVFQNSTDKNATSHSAGREICEMRAWLLLQVDYLLQLLHDWTTLSK